MLVSFSEQQKLKELGNQNPYSPYAYPLSKNTQIATKVSQEKITDNIFDTRRAKNLEYIDVRLLN